MALSGAFRLSLPSLQNYNFKPSSHARTHARVFGVYSENKHVKTYYSYRPALQLQQALIAAVTVTVHENYGQLAAEPVGPIGTYSGVIPP